MGELQNRNVRQEKRGEVGRCTNLYYLKRSSGDDLFFWGAWKTEKEKVEF